LSVGLSVIYVNIGRE